MLKVVRVLRSNTIVKNENITVGYSDGSPFNLIDVSGLDPVSSNINTTTSVFKPGSYLNSTTVNNRNIVFTILLQPNRKYNTIEACRNRIYDIFPSGGTVLLSFETDYLPNPVTITGHVERVESPFFTQKPIVTISIVCVDPYFSDQNITVVNSEKDYTNFAEHVGTAPSAVIIKKTFQQLSGQFHINRNQGRAISFNEIPANHTLEISFEPTNRYVNLITPQGSKIPGYSYITGGNMEITISKSQAHVGFFGYTKANPGFELSFYKRYIGL